MTRRGGLARGAPGGYERVVDDGTRVRDRDRMVAGMRPLLRPGSYVFVTVPGGVPDGVTPVMSFAEDEGLSLIVARTQADAAGLAYDLVTAWITLRVNSALDGVGLTAAVSGVLAEAGISCNVVAATHHDHLFVPEPAAAEAVRLLEALAAATRTST
jgi:uncharacterized protein